MFSLSFTPLPFHRWYLANRDNVEEQYVREHGPLDGEGVQDEECDECSGIGYVDCNQGHTHDCSECDGSGKIDRSPETILEEYAGGIYREQVKRDQEKVAKFVKEQEG